MAIWGSAVFPECRFELQICKKIIDCKYGARAPGVHTRW